VRGAHRELERGALHAHLAHVAPRPLHGLLDGDRHLTGLAISKANAASAIANYRQGREAELAATLDHLAHAVYGHQLLAEAVTTHFTRCHRLYRPWLKLQPGLACGVRKRLHSTVVAKARAVERDPFNSGSLGTFGDQ